ncbi:MAG: DNA replication/repair protein RecF [Pseudomonadota bacterium]
MKPTLRVTELKLQNFRNYQAAELRTDNSIVVLSGANGAGKTNILEAISLLTPGRGLRRTQLAECAKQNGPGSWAVAAKINLGGDEISIGTGLSSVNDDDGAQRDVRINGMNAKKSSDLSDYVSALWLTPENDGLFRGTAGERRRFLDRMTMALDPAHNTRVNTLEKLLRSRNRLLADPDHDASWLDAIERELSEAAIAVSAARMAQIDSLMQSIDEHHDTSSPFPFAIINLEGEIEDLLREHTSVEAEDAYRRILRQMRSADAHSGRTTRGSHLSDMCVQHGPKDMAAELASTGEQKALLVGLILAQTRHVVRTRGTAPLLLLDEIAAHLDSLRRAALYDELERVGAQAWLTGTDSGMFSTLSGRAVFIEVANGTLQIAA